MARIDRSGAPARHTPKSAAVNVRRMGAILTGKSNCRRARKSKGRDVEESGSGSRRKPRRRVDEVAQRGCVVVGGIARDVEDDTAAGGRWRGPVDGPPALMWPDEIRS